MLRAPFKYHGGKQSLAAWIAARLPHRKTYAEPFAGMCSVMLARAPADYELINDLDRNIYAFWVEVRDRPERLEDRLTRTPYRSRDIYTEAAQALQNPGLRLEDRAYWWAVATQMSYGGMLARYSRRYGANSGKPTAWPQLQPLADRLRGVEVEQCDALDLLAYTAGEPDQTLYVDPPYPTARLDGYKAGLVPDFDRLAEALVAQQGAVAVSGYPGDWPQLDQAGWNRLDTPGVQQSMGRLPEVRVEVLWTNYDPPAQEVLF